MSLMSVILALVVIGIVVYVVNTYIPVDPKIKNIIMIIAVAFVAIWFLQEMGWLGSIRGGADRIAIK